MEVWVAATKAILPQEAAVSCSAPVFPLLGWMEQAGGAQPASRAGCRKLRPFQ